MTASRSSQAQRASATPAPAMGPVVADPPMGLPGRPALLAPLAGGLMLSLLGPQLRQTLIGMSSDAVVPISAGL